MPLGGASLAPGVKKGLAVGAGEILARSASPFQADLPSPLPGRISGLSGTHILLDVDLAAGGAPPAPIRFRDLGPVEALKALKSLGLTPPLPPAPGDPVIASAFDPEPGINLAQSLFEDQRGVMEAGIQFLALLFPGKAIVLAHPPQIRPLALPSLTPVSLKLPYPRALPVFLKLRLLRRHDPLARGVVSARTLHLWGTVARGGITPRRWPLSLQNIPIQAPFGISPRDLLALANLSPQDGDAVVVGGLARGRATARLEEGLSPRVEAVNLIRKRKIPRRLTPAPCSRCGRCRQNCPLDLPVDLLGASPWPLWPEILAEFPALATCPRCGLCALACPSRRPLNALRRSPPKGSRL
ncbi:MAG: hypothetical protein LBO66_03475 [Deltaproteobacteria bacterium]|nr:hypothetical protein [Deltaproteobacteria bacterium]